VIAAGAGTVALFARERSAQARQEEALKKELDQGPVVRVARVAVAPADRVVSLPAEVRAEQHATLYAKVSGYVSKVLVERGDKVRKGQELAVLESPDLAAQVASAQAELTFRRQQLAAWSASPPPDGLDPGPRGGGGGGEGGRCRAGARGDPEGIPGAARAVRRDHHCPVRRTRARSSPRRPGSTSSAQPLLEVAQLDRLRIALHLGQEDAARGPRGGRGCTPASPDQAPFEARISRISQSLDPRTRTMLCEIDLAQPPSGLYPGAFVQTRLPVHGLPRPLLPTEALLGQGGQLFVALVEDGKVHFQRVRLAWTTARMSRCWTACAAESRRAQPRPRSADGAPVRIQQEVPPRRALGPRPGWAWKMRAGARHLRRAPAR